MIPLDKQTNKGIKEDPTHTKETETDYKEGNKNVTPKTSIQVLTKKRETMNRSLPSPTKDNTKSPSFLQTCRTLKINLNKKKKKTCEMV